MSFENILNAWQLMNKNVLRKRIQKNLIVLTLKTFETPVMISGSAATLSPDSCQYDYRTLRIATAN